MEKPERSWWQSMKEDATYRATFLAVFVVPALLMGGVAVWVMRAMATAH